MSTIAVAASQAYDVLIDEMSIDEAGALCRRASGGTRALIIADSNTGPLYAHRVRTSLEQAGYTASEFIFDAGEQSKTIATYTACLNACCAAGLDRDSAIVALGGGVVGDMAGFTAATYMRGCRCVQIPTSLLACVDSSVGGKTAIDLPAGKNLAGAFFQPDAVLIDTSVLSTLDKHFFVDGCAEIIKYGAIANAQLLRELGNPLVPGDARITDVITACVKIKRDIVNKDEREAGVRQLLNFGHTLGHAIEKLSNFSVTHGHAVACGMAMAARAGTIMGATTADSLAMLLKAIRAAGLPASASECGLEGVSADRLYEASLSDKKRHGDSMNIILMTEPGKARVQSLQLPEFRTFIDYALQEGM